MDDWWNYIYDPNTDYSPPEATYSNEGLNYPTPESTQGSGGSPINASTYSPNLLQSIISALGKVGSTALTSAQNNPLPWLAGLAGLIGGARSATSPVGGVGKAYGRARRPMTPNVRQGRYGPISMPTFAAQGGIMHAYANGGNVRPFPMQDGGFVMTKRAVDGAGGPQGMQQRIPEAQPIVGPGHGTSDSIPAYIQGRNGRTPAAVSNGEMYIPPGQRSTQGLYALMKALERKA